jgi:retron-type reverse transcriptase
VLQNGDALSVAITSRKVNYILDADVRFGSVSQDWLVRFLEYRVGDMRIIRLIRKWLKAGILEDGVVTVPDSGTGQGAVISPLLGNIYLHHVFDLWAERWRRQEARGDVIVVRYADDLVAGFEHEDDARRFLDAMRERFAAFSLSLHPVKTRVIEFGRHATEQPARTPAEPRSGKQRSLRPKRQPPKLRTASAPDLLCWSSPTASCVRRWGEKHVPL